MTQTQSTPLWPWISGLFAASVVFAALGFFAGRVNAPQTQAANPVAGASPASGLTDLSSMTPREQADRLFDRIMRAHGAADMDQVTFFAPMAIDAYEMIGPLDSDARYHVGLIHAITGSTDAALAQADSLEQEVAGHLFAYMLRSDVFQVLGQSDDLTAQYRAFLENYDGEIAVGRPEYQMHTTALDTFLEEARGAVGQVSN